MPFLFLLVGGLLGLGGLAYGADQQDKREADKQAFDRERGAFQAALADLDSLISQKEAARLRLLAECQLRGEHIVALTQEITRLRGERTALLRRAA